MVRHFDAWDFEPMGGKGVAITKVGVIGVGEMGSLYARLLAQTPDVEVVWVCGRSAGHVETLSRELGAHGYVDGDYHSALTGHPEVQGVVVATPDAHHVGPGCAALGAGKVVMMEKPLATSVVEARQIIAVANSTGAPLLLCHSLRFDPRYAAAMAAVQAGKVGDLVSLFARRKVSAEYARAVARRNPVSLAHRLAVHDIDFMLALKGTLPARVYGRGARGALADVGIEHCIWTVLTFRDESIGVIEVAGVAPATSSRTAWAECELLGTKGSIEIPAFEQGVAILVPGAEEHPDTVYSAQVQGLLVGAYRTQVEHFCAIMRRAAAPAVTGRDGLNTVVVVEALLKSMREGREIMLEEAEPA